MKIFSIVIGAFALSVITSTVIALFSVFAFHSIVGILEGRTNLKFYVLHNVFYTLDVTAVLFYFVFTLLLWIGFIGLLGDWHAANNTTVHNRF